MPWWLVRVYVEGLEAEFTKPPNPESGEEDFEFYADALEDANRQPPEGIEVVDDLASLGATTTTIQ